MTTHDTAEVLRAAMKSAFCEKWTSDLKRESQSVLERAIDRLALLERGIERVSATGEVTDCNSTPIYNLMAIIEERGREGLE